MCVSVCAPSRGDALRVKERDSRCISGPFNQMHVKNGAALCPHFPHSPLLVLTSSTRDINVPILVDPFSPLHVSFKMSGSTESSGPESRSTLLHPPPSSTSFHGCATYNTCLCGNGSKQR